MSENLQQAIDHFSALMEAQNSKLNTVLELLSDMPKIEDVRRLEEKVDKLSDRMDVVVAAVQDTSADVIELRRQSGYTRLSHVGRPRWWPRKA